MHAVRKLVAHQLSAGWRGWVVLALLVGLAGGAVLTAAAGARRTASAYPRFLQVSRASDVLVAPAGTGIGGYYDALGRLPGVAALAPLAGLQAGPLSGGRPDLAKATVLAPLDGRAGHLVEIPKVLAGRLPLRDRPAEVAVDQVAAQALHLHVGSKLALAAVPGAGSPVGKRFRRLAEHVVGIIVTRGSVVAVNDQDKIPAILASPALFHQLGPRYRAFDGASVQLRLGTSADAFGRRALALARSFPRTGGQVFVADESTQAATVERSIRPQAVALALFAFVLAITALLVVGQAASRLLSGAASDNPTLAALGMTRRQLTAAGLAEVAAAAIAGAVIAVGVAIMASPLMPIGPARLAEPDPGVHIDVPALAIGALAIVALLVARAAWPAWRAGSADRGVQRGPEHIGRPSKVATWLARTGAPVSATTGARLALEPGPRRTAVPARSAIAGLGLSVMTVAAAFTFGASLLHLVHTPRQYGQTWDIAVDLQFGTVTPRRMAALLAHVPGISSWSYGNHGIISVDGAVVPAVGVAPGQGPLLSATLLDGRPPRSEHEIVLGTSVLRRIGRRVGQSVTVRVNDRRETARIVGRAVFPNFGQGSFTPTDLGQGAETAASLLPAGQSGGQGPPGFSIVLLRFEPGPRRAADIASFERALTAFCANVDQSTCVVRDQRPNGVTNYAPIDSTPELLAAVLAVLGLAVLWQFAVLSGRRRRREFAILRAIGLLQRQVIFITAWQIMTIAGLAVAAGLPLGLAAGRWTWAWFASNLGISTGASIPSALLLYMVPTVFLVANAVAFWPARTVARLSPAAVLRAE